MTNYLIGLATQLAYDNKSNAEINLALSKGFSLPRWGKYKDKAILSQIKAFALKLRARLNTMESVNKQAHIKKSDRKVIADQYMLKFATKSNEIKKIRKTKNEYIRKVEYEFKKEDIEEMLSYDDNVLFLCSSHTQPAKDHEPYQGKVYVDENWESKVRNPKVKKRLKHYISKHNIRTIQWVTGAPVYMVYRPHCKHYFTPVSITEAINSSALELSKKHHTLVENKNVKTDENYRKHLAQVKLLRKLPQTIVVRNKLKKERALMSKYKK